MPHFWTKYQPGEILVATYFIGLHDSILGTVHGFLLFCISAMSANIFSLTVDGMCPGTFALDSLAQGSGAVSDIALNLTLILIENGIK